MGTSAHQNGMQRSPFASCMFLAGAAWCRWGHLHTMVFASRTQDYYLSLRSRLRD